MTDHPSAYLSRAIYEQLGPGGLAARTSDSWDRETVQRVMDVVSAGQRVLDAGCGYGRIAIPLASAGIEVVGLDVCRAMLDEAAQQARESQVNISWVMGDLCALPFDDHAFDVVLCLWLTFHEVLREDEQLAVLTEMRRVLKPGGIALIDGPPYDTKSEAERRQEDPQQAHGMERADAAYRRLLAAAGVDDFQLYTDDCPGRPRMFLKFRVPTTENGARQATVPDRST